MKIPLATPPWTKLGKRLESATRKALYDFQMVEGVSKLAIALSGGKDSLSLLFLLKAISGRGFPDLDIHAIHVHGAYSCGAGIHVDYLRAICQELRVNFILKESKQTLENLECYRCSRERRRLLFEATKSVGASTIAFGHHQDDNVQTILMNLLHKAEFCGNLPKLHMQDFGVTIIRPLTYIREEEIKSFASKHGFSRAMCRCPVGQNSMRKKMDNLIKEIEVLYPHARNNIAQAGLTYGSDKARKNSA
ncbi:MAG: ATP-binding protein [bacterium]